MGVFVDDESFQSEKALLEYQFPKKGLSGGVMTFSISLKPGIYGLSLLDDEDSDRQMKYGMLGIPREGFGFSGYYHTGFTKPGFDAFSFTRITSYNVCYTKLLRPEQSRDPPIQK